MNISEQIKQKYYNDPTEYKGEEIPPNFKENNNCGKCESFHLIHDFFHKYDGICLKYKCLTSIKNVCDDFKEWEMKLEE